MKNLTLEIKGELNINDLLKVLEIIVKPDVAVKILLPKDNVEDIGTRVGEVLFTDY